MTDDDEDREFADSAEPTVAASANKCLESFQLCLLRGSTVHARELSKVEDQVARVSTWATAMGVFAPERASMDHRLRYAPDVRNVVNGLLESLDYRIRSCSDILDSIGKTTPADSLCAKDEHLKQSFIHIGTEISHLNKISNTIMRASKEIQTQKANNFRIEDDDGNDAEPMILGIFEHYVGDRFPNISKNIQQRLVRAMIMRWKRVLHRRHRQGIAATKPKKIVPKAIIEMTAVQQTDPLANARTKPGTGKNIPISAFTTAPSLVQSATTLDPHKFKKASLSPSVVSESKTIALDDHETLIFPSAPGMATKQKYEEIRSQREAEYKKEIEANGITMDARSKFERLKRSDLEAIGEVTCPYCLYALPAEVMFSEQKWLNHVKNDLDPYVCLFEDCDQPDMLFTHGDEWRSHMKEHCRFWRCNSHREMGSFSTGEEYMNHIQATHNTNTLSNTQLRALASRSARKVAKLFSMCPLCGKEDSTAEGPLDSHIAGHLRSLALKSLPSYHEVISEGAGNDEDTAGVSRQHTRSTVRDFIEDKDILELTTEDLDLEQAYQNNSKNFLGNPHLDFDQSHENWDASFYERISYRMLAWDPEGDKTFQSFLLEYPKQEKEHKVRSDRVPALEAEPPARLPTFVPTENGVSSTRSHSPIAEAPSKGSWWSKRPKLYLWSCCECGDAGMTTEIDSCPNCQKMRCSNCQVFTTTSR